MTHTLQHSIKMRVIMLAIFLFTVGSLFSAVRGATSTLTFSKACGGSGTANDGAVWSVSSDASESTYESTRGIHYGTGSAAVSYLTLITSDIQGTITQIQVNASGASKTSAKLNVTVGGVAFGSQQSLTSSSTDYTLTGSATGTIVVTVSQTSAQKALYVMSIVVTYTPPTGETTTMTIDAIGITNTNKYVSTTAGTLSATVRDASNNKIDGASVTWSGNNDDVATINVNTGAVTLVAAGIVTFTASYAGVEGTYRSSSSTYELIVTNEDPALNKVATPIFSVASGTVEKGTSVAISCATEGATIYYTTDGSVPTTSSTAYSSTITINSSLTIKAIAIKDGLANSSIGTATYTIRDYVTLPFSFDNGKGSLPTGLTHKGLGDDYTYAPKLKFDDTKDKLILKINEAPGELKFDIVGQGFSGGTFTIQYSVDGSTYTDLDSYSSLGTQETKTYTNIPATTRYIQWIYTQKSTGNVALGNINLSKCESVTVGSAGYTTYVAKNAISFPDAVTAYIATARSENTVTLTQKFSVPEGTAVVVKGSAGTYSLPTITSTPADVSNNRLQASTGSTTGDGNTIYALGVGKAGDNEGKVGFYLVGSGVTVPSGKAYLSVPAGVKEFLTFTFDEATGISATIVDNEPLTKNNAQIFSISGQRLQKMQKGINIVNGKKVLIK